MASYSSNSYSSQGLYGLQAKNLLDILLSNFESGQPFLFFPVRLETHFRTREIIEKREIKDNKGHEVGIENKIRLTLEHTLDAIRMRILLRPEYLSTLINKNNKSSQVASINRIFDNYIKSMSSMYVDELKAMESTANNLLQCLNINKKPSDELISDFVNKIGLGEQMNFPGQDLLIAKKYEEVLVKQKELCVRIIPDEIMLDYHTDKLSEKEVKDGKFFWLQWFIASGSEKREYEAWEVLCSKYPVYRAAWICRCTEPAGIWDYKVGNKYFYRRPYTEMERIEEYCEDIYNGLAKITLDESKTLNKLTEEYQYEYDLRTNLTAIKESLFRIDSALTSCEYIVDYLYDNLKTTIDYLRRRLDSFLVFYQKFSGVYDKNLRRLEIWDIDYTLLTSFRKEVESFHERIESKRITLDDMIDLYLKDDKIFPSFSVRNSRLDVPVSNIMPDRFFLIGEIANGKSGGNEDNVYAISKPVRRNLQMAFDPNKKKQFSIDSLTGDLNVEGGLDWMFDYDKAVEAGMAITVPINDDVTKFNYIYVLGVNSSSSKNNSLIENLFMGHNYSASGLEILKAGTPTNIVDGGPAAQSLTEEELIRKRYEIEVEHRHRYSSSPVRNDAKILANVLGVDYDKVMGRVVNYDNLQDRKQMCGYAALYDHFISEYQDKKQIYEVLVEYRHFFCNCVRGFGNIPSIKINDTPYGFLQITDYEKFYNSLPDCNSKKLLAVLMVLASKMKKIRQSAVVYEGKIENDPSIKERKYLEMAGQTPHSVDFVKRYAVSSPLIPSNIPDQPEDSPLGTLSKSGYFAPQRVSDSYEQVTIEDLEKIVKSRCDINVTDEEAHLIASTFLDLFTHRLDAWMSAILYEYNGMNTGSAEKPCAGAYGWLFNLEENDRATVEKEQRDKIVKMMKLQNFNDKAIYASAPDAEDPGHFIVAPSIQHALTAAVLRSAYIKSQKSSDDSHICVNLSSMRARQALRLLQGLKTGMSTGVILGADLERYMHESYKDLKNGAELDQYIYPLRQLFPLSVDIAAGNGDSRANSYTMQVINGEALLNTFIREWNWDGSVSEWLDKNRNSAKCLSWYHDLLAKETNIEKSGSYKALFKLIERMTDTYDALNDILLSEGVHRLIMGDKASYYAISSFLSKGEGNLPDMSILETPDEHVVVAHKAAVMMPAVKAAPDKPLCMAEPSVNCWVESMLDGMDNIIFAVKIEKNGSEETKVLSLADLGIKGIEYLYLSGFQETLLNYIETRYRLSTGVIGGNVTIIQRVKAPLERKSLQVDLAENRIRIARIKDIVLRSRAMKASDFLTQICEDSKNESLIDIDELSARFTAMKSNLHYLVSDIHSWTLEIEGAKILTDEQVRNAYSLLCDCVESGMTNSLGKFDTDLFADGINPIQNRARFVEIQKMQAKFVTEIKNAEAELTERIAAAEKVLENSEDKLSSEVYISAIKELTFSNFRVVPRFYLQPDPSSAISDDIEYINFDSTIDGGIGKYQNLNNDLFDDWQDEISEVRDGMRSWYQLSMVQSAFGTDITDAAVIQMDSKGNEITGYWLGRDVYDESRLQDADSLVIFNKSAYSKRSSARRRVTNGGLILDSWIEYIPYRKHNAGLVFHSDRPDAEAPQAMLLAYHPDVNKKTKWNADSLLGILGQTRFLLMNRAVEPDHLYNDAESYSILPLIGRLLTDHRMTLSSQGYKADSRTVQDILAGIVGGDNLKD